AIYLGNGEHAKSITKIAALDIGPVHVTYTEFIIAPSISDEGGNVAGVIGYDILKHFDLDFDFGSDQLNLFSPDHCEGKVVYWSPTYTDAPVAVTPGGSI